MHDLGFERAGWTCVGQVEIDPFCSAVLAKHWPHVPRWADVRDVSAVDVVRRCGLVDLITGGFACQDLSTSGRGAGLTRVARSGITFRQLFRLARRIRSRWLLLENVPAIRTRGYDRVASVLERIGYTVRPFVVDPAILGSHMRRGRAWMVANLPFIGQPESRQPQDVPASAIDWQTNQSINAVRTRWPSGPKAVADIPRATDGPANRMERLTAIGNGNPPQVAELIARTINAAMRELAAA